MGLSGEVFLREALRGLPALFERIKDDDEFAATHRLEALRETLSLVVLDRPADPCSELPGGVQYPVRIVEQGSGQGNIIGGAILPVIKITANPLTARTMAEHIDLDVSGLLRLEYDLPEAGRRLLALIDRVVNGRLTCSESLGHREFVITKLYRSA